jgi:hypothetical protein
MQQRCTALVGLPTNHALLCPSHTLPSCRQSRLLRLDGEGYQLFTVDHEDAGRLRLDLRHTWGNPASPEPVTPEEELVCDPSSGWLCSQLDCGLGEEEGAGGAVQWLPAGPNCLLAVQGDLLVEYDMETRSPVGLVAYLEGRGGGSGASASIHLLLQRLTHLCSVYVSSVA